eukprot:12937015-Prorocentrum_lima.AAC.1
MYLRQEGPLPFELHQILRLYGTQVPFGHVAEEDAALGTRATRRVGDEPLQPLFILAVCLAEDH